MIKYLSGMLILGVSLFYFFVGRSSDGVDKRKVEIMELRGEFVTHKVFGKGEIMNSEDNCVTVQFYGLKETKRFVFPSAFGIFLIPVNQDLCKQIQDYKEELARSIGGAVLTTAVAEPPKKLKKPAARKVGKL